MKGIFNITQLKVEDLDTLGHQPLIHSMTRRDILNILDIIFI